MPQWVKVAGNQVSGFRVSPQQEAALLEGNAGGLVLCAVAYDAGVDAGRLRASLERAVERHEILRTSFLRLPGVRVPQQVVRPEWGIRWTDATAGTPTTVDAALDVE